MSEVKEELIDVSKLDPTKIFKTGGMQPVINEIEKIAKSFVHDPETAKGRAEITSLAYKVAQIKTAIEKEGKSITAKLKAEIAPIQAEINLAKTSLSDLNTKIKQPVTEFKEKEKVADDQLKLKLLDLTFTEGVAGLSCEELKNSIASVEAIAIDESFGKYQREATEKKVEFIQKASELIPLKEKHEKEAIELEQLRKEKEERQAKENEERIRKEEQEKAEQALKAQEVRLKQEAENKIKAEQAEAKAREEDIEHQRKINNEALDCLIGLGVPKDQALIIVKAVILGQIKNMKIQY
jgi:hypothetical protein